MLVGEEAAFHGLEETVVASISPPPPPISATVSPSRIKRNRVIRACKIWSSSASAMQVMQGRATS